MISICQKIDHQSLACKYANAKGLIKQEKKEKKAHKAH